MAVLTTTDAFFVAYQERAGITMHLGAELELAGPLDRATLDAAIARTLVRWPALGKTLAKTLGGLAWRGTTRRVLTIAGRASSLDAWRNTPIDPFTEPPFRVLWIQRTPTSHVLAFRCHHAVADGMLFVAIVGELLAPTSGGHRSATHPLGFSALWRDARLAQSWRHVRTIAREAKADRSARVALRAVTPGAIASRERRLGERAALERRAAAAEVRPAWFLAAAWLRALHAWNTRRGEPNPRLSVEVPVSLRRGPHALAGTGNHLTVLTLFGDARAPLADLAVSLLGAPARFLPWSVFRRVAVTTTSTGFATTHFTWLEHARDFREDVRRQSNGALVVRDQRFYTPVCLRMGIALAVMAWRDELQLSITYRRTGLDETDVDEVFGLLLDEVG